MKPDEIVQALEAAVAETAQRLEHQRAALTAVRAAFDPAQVVLTVEASPAEAERIVRAYQRAPKSANRGRLTVRRAAASAARALRTVTGRKKAPADGSLTERIVSTLTAFQAPMKKSAIVDAAKAREADVTAELKRLKADGQVTIVGASRAARWSLPKFANVIVADDVD